MTEAKATQTVKDEKSAFSSLLPIFSFLQPYKLMISFALLALLLTALVNLSLGQGLKLIIDTGFIANSQSQLRQAVQIMLGLVALMALGTYCRFYLMSWLGERIVADIRSAVFKHLVVMHPSYYEENRSGEIMSRLTADTALIESIIGSSFSMALRSSLTLIGGIVMLVLTNFKLSLMVLLSIPLVLVPIFVFGRKVRKLASSSQDAIADISAYAGEVIQNIKVVQSYTHEEKETLAFSNEVEKAFSVAKLRIKQRSLLIAIVITLSASSVTMMLWVGGLDVLSGKITGGDLAAFVFYALMVAMSAATIAEVYGALQRAAGSASRILELLSIKSEISSPEQPKKLNFEQQKMIEFVQVNFNYPSRPDTKALNELSFTIKQGETVAFVGSSGAGKSTLFELLQRFYDPQSGRILFAGENLKALDVSELRAHIGVVAQQPVLFSTDVMHNIAYGKPNASKEEIIEAAKQAHAHDFIMQLPDTYDSFLGEKGVRLSGGQKQRIALARAILKDPKVLLLDEATSALDANSEYHVQQALDKLMQKRTTLIIAHRLSTVRHADRIIVMEDGKIIATGTHQTLLHSSPVYNRLCELQFNDKEE